MAEQLDSHYPNHDVTMFVLHPTGKQANGGPLDGLRRPGTGSRMYFVPSKCASLSPAVALVCNETCIGQWPQNQAWACRSSKYIAWLVWGFDQIGKLYRYELPTVPMDSNEYLKPPSKQVNLMSWIKLQASLSHWRPGFDSATRQHPFNIKAARHPEDIMTLLRGRFGSVLRSNLSLPILH